MEGHCSTGECPHWAVVPMEEEEEDEEEEEEEEDEDKGMSLKQTTIKYDCSFVIWRRV